MRVLHVETGRHLYGGPRQVLDLLGELPSQGVESLLVSSAGSEVLRHATQAGLAVAPVSCQGDLDVAFMWRLGRVLRERRPDVVHLHSRRGADSWGLMAAKRAGIPVVLSRRVDHRDPRWIARWRYGAADHVIAISQKILDVVQDQGCNPAKATLVPSSVSVSEWDTPADAKGSREAFGLPEAGMAVAMVAQFIPRKGHREVLEALAQPGLEEVSVVMFGRGPLSDDMKQVAARLGVDQRVVFGGFRDDLPKWLSSFDALVHPAHKEGLGVAVLQAGAAGLPVVGGRAGGIPEIVEHEVTGLLVEPGDVPGLAAALKRLANDPTRAKEMGQAGRNRVEERFSREAMVKGNAEVYRLVTGIGK